MEPTVQELEAQLIALDREVQGTRAKMKVVHDALEARLAQDRAAFLATRGPVPPGQKVGPGPAAMTDDAILSTIQTLRDELERRRNG